MKNLRKFLAFLLITLLLVPSFPAADAAPVGKVKVLIGFKAKADRQLVEKGGGRLKHRYRVVNAVAAEVPKAALAVLTKNPGVAYIEPDITVNAVADKVPWGVDRIDAEMVHPYNKGTGIKVCIIDTGVDYTHRDLDDNYKGGIDYVNDDLDPLDDNGHGTHCAGIIAAEANGAGIVGVAPEAHLYAVKALDASGNGLLSDVVAGIDWAVANGMDIVSMSLEARLPSRTLEAACNNAYAAGLLLVAAAGNAGPPKGKNTTVNYPARYASVIAVSATDTNDVIAGFSSAGPEVELAAPGVSVYSTLPTYPVTLTSECGLNYGRLSGTSAACPHVAGTAALAMAAYPGYTNEQIRSLLRNTADDLGIAGFDRYYGYGLVDAGEAAPNGGLSCSFTTPPAPANSMHIASITMSAYNYQYKGINYRYAKALVTVVDRDGKPVSGATVSGHWSGLTTGSDTRVTNTSGQVNVMSDWVPNSSGTFTFTVDNVNLSGYTYDPAANAETSDSISV
ncbi:MAG: S8 family peptidase [Bacillota bacterium]